ncbi:LysR family transcriptional regulator [Azospirillum halopraeferens]|uniref:LysR family transcriptional regulator n=1 Tax=Azospirillum halopraeferens TaxID=34010 RepID=UPI0003F51B4A|nr:LysR family transcriptional regulator [Azospirillum halopraeferens]
MTAPDLRDLAAFAAVARHRSFRRAARELGVPVSSLSQRLRDLEERLGVRLLNRTTRSVAPTQAGETLMESITPALRAVEEALDAVRSLDGEASGRLRINAPAPAAELVLAPMVAPFLARHPRVTLEIVVEAELVDIVADGYDAGVRYEENLARDMIAVPLGPPERYRIVATPAVLERFGTPREPRDLMDRPCIGILFPGRSRKDWEFEKDGHTFRLPLPYVFATSHVHLQLRAALDGAGFVMTFEGYVREALADGRLVSVLDDWCPPFSGPFLYYPSRHRQPPALAAFVAFVAAWRARERERGDRLMPAGP